MDQIKKYYQKYSTYLREASYPVAFIILFIQNAITLLLLDAVFVALGSSGISFPAFIGITVAVAIGSLYGTRSSRSRNDEK
jgi:uncharacterized membrane protein SpoIIM required for sporulation